MRKTEETKRLMQRLTEVRIQIRDAVKRYREAVDRDGLDEEQRERAYAEACETCRQMAIGLDVASHRVAYRHAAHSGLRICDFMGTVWIRMAGEDRIELRCVDRSGSGDFELVEMYAEANGARASIDVRGQTDLDSGANMMLSEGGIHEQVEKEEPSRHGPGSRLGTGQGDGGAKPENPAGLPEGISELSRTWPAAEQAWLAGFVDRIRNEYRGAICRAVVFGSKARGDWHAESDIDVLVIVRDEARPHRKAIEALSDELPGADESLPMVMARTETEWARLGEWGAAFHQTVEAEGVRLL